MTGAGASSSQCGPGVGKPSVCFAALNAYAVLSGRTDVQHTGGAEVQQVLVARELARRGFQVSFLTYDHGQPDGEIIDGIRVLRAYRKEEGWPGIRFFRPRWTGLWRAMERADADIYYQRAGGAETGQVAMWCRRHGRQFVFAAALDADCEKATRHLCDRRSRWLYRCGLRRADMIITQTASQQQLLQRAFALSSTVIRSCSADPGMRPPLSLPLGASSRVLWLGRFTPQKDLHCLLDVATMCPQLEFDLVGDHTLETPYAAGVRRRAAEIRNVHLRGWVPHRLVDSFYRRASLLLCTSSFEGFPNTFLEAWARGVPVATTVDPDAVVQRHSLGVVAPGAKDLAAGLRWTLGNEHVYGQYAANARRYFVENHTISSCAAAYEDLLAKLHQAWRASASDPGRRGRSLRPEPRGGDDLVLERW